MTPEQIQNLVKKLEPFSIGFTAVENRLKNSNGMELWIIAAAGASRLHDWEPL